MHKTQQVLSDITTFIKYARYLPEENRRETWDEIVDRYLAMMIKRYGTEDDLQMFLDEKAYDNNAYSPMTLEIILNGEYLYDRKVLMSMRAAQFAGPAAEKNESRIYNCGYLPFDDHRAFSEMMFLLLGGTGIGYSIQKGVIENLPLIQKPSGKRYQKFLVNDSIEGWADAIKALMKSYFGFTKSKIRFDFSDIRAKGERLITAGGKAPGPEPLCTALFQIRQVLERKDDGARLLSREVHDIICHIADAVRAGGIRRAALISLFSVDDDYMRTAKHGHWWVDNPQRGRANNSGVFVRGRADKAHFLKYWKQVQESNSGEPGIFWTNDPAYGTNPCGEISLRPNTFCNLTEINGGDIYEEARYYTEMSADPDKDLDSFARDIFHKRCQVAAFFGTLQAGFTDFHYLRPIWRKNTERDALIGVGITGIANGDLIQLRDKYEDVLTEGARIVMETNERIAKYIGINKAARCTTIKPSGTTSCVLGTSSGIHAWHDEYYIRNIQCTVGDNLYNHFMENHPGLIKNMDHQAGHAVIGIPQKAPENAIFRDNESALGLLNRVNIFNKEWVHAGHRRGPNKNNVSTTISIKPDEWQEVGERLWETRNDYNGVAVMPFDGGTYADAPFITIDKEKYEFMLPLLDNINITNLREEDDQTDLSGTEACAGGKCDIV